MDDQSTEIQRERKNKCCSVRCLSALGTVRETAPNALGVFERATLSNAAYTAK